MKRFFPLSVLFAAIFTFFLTRAGVWDETKEFFTPANSLDQVHFEADAQLSDHLVHQLVRPLATVNFYPPVLPFYEKVRGRVSLLKDGRQMLEDIGAIPIKIQTEDGALLDGVYLEAKTYFQKRDKAFEKWSQILPTAGHESAHSFLEIQDGATTFEGMLNLPQEALYPSSQQKIRAVVFCFGVGNLYEWNLQAASMYLARGMDVLLFNYRGHGKSSGTPSWKGTSVDGLAAVNFAKNRLNCEYDELLVHGYSLGSGPAIYSGVKCPKLNVLVDRGFSRLSYVAKDRTHPVGNFVKPLLVRSVELFYRYPNEDWIGLVQGRVLLVEGVNDTYIVSENAKRLFHAFARSRLGLHPDKESVIALADRHWIKVKGGHTSKHSHGGESAWLADAQSQQKLNQFLYQDATPDQLTQK